MSRAINGIKRCSKCKEEKPVSEFHHRKLFKDGYYPQCRTCRGTKHIQNSKVVNDLKKCGTCQQIKPLNQFHKNKSTLSGYSSSCKNCRTLYNVNNKDSINNYRRSYSTNRRRNDLTYKLGANLRHRVNMAVKGFVKSKTTMELVGCTIEELTQYLESQFTGNMSWDNYGKGGWHVDHIVPCSAFDLSDPVEQKQCFHYTNLQPLWESDNLAKSNKWVL